MWPFRRKPPAPPPPQSPSGEPLDRYVADLDRWVEGLLRVIGEFPGQDSLEGIRFSEHEGHALDRIAEVYGEGLRVEVERLVLETASLGRLRARRKVDKDSAGPSG